MGWARLGWVGIGKVGLGWLAYAKMGRVGTG